MGITQWAYLDGPSVLLQNTAMHTDGIIIIIIIIIVQKVHYE